ncbi:MAG: ABC transporter permease [Dehalococcoidia bacterium]
MRGSLSDVQVIFGEEFRREVSRIAYRVMTLLVPALLILGLVTVPVLQGVTAGGGGPAGPALLGYVDPSGVLEPVRNTPGLVPFGDLQAGVNALAADEISELFHVPGDYIETGRVDWYRHEGGLFTTLDLGQRFSDILALAVVADRVPPEIAERVEMPADYEIQEIDSEGQLIEDPRTAAQEVGGFLVPFIFAILLMISIFTSSGRLLQSVADEKENRMIEMLVTSVSPFSMMTGKVLALGAAGLVQITVWVLSALLIGPRIMDQIPGAGDLAIGPGLLVVIIAFFLAGYFLFAVIMAGLGTATASAREASQISAIVTMPAVVPIWLSAIIFESPDGTLARVLTFIPLTAPTTVMLRISAGEPSFTDIAIGFVVTMAAGVALLWVAARVFRAGLLLYGQRMSLRLVWRAMRQAG